MTACVVKKCLAKLGAGVTKRMKGRTVFKDERG